MPIPAFLVLGVAVELLADDFCGVLVLCLARAVVPPEDVVSNAVVVERVAGVVPVCDCSISFHDDIVDLASVPIDERLVFGQGNGCFIAFVKRGLRIAKCLSYSM